MCQECLACKSSFMVVIHSQGLTALSESPAARSQLLLCKLAGSLLQSNGRCSVSVTHCAGLGACKPYEDPAGACQRPVGRWETLCSRKSSERKRGQRPGPRGLYKLSHRLPEAQGLPAGQHWAKGLTPCPPVLRHAITLQVVKRATVPDIRSHMEREN